MSNYENTDFITPANEQLYSIGNLPSLENFGISETQPYTHTCLNIGNETMRVSPIEADTCVTSTETEDIIFPLGAKKIASSQAKSLAWLALHQVGIFFLHSFAVGGSRNPMISSRPDSFLC